MVLNIVLKCDRNSGNLAVMNGLRLRIMDILKANKLAIHPSDTRIEDDFIENIYKLTIIARYPIIGMKKSDPEKAYNEIILILNASKSYLSYQSLWC